MRIETIGNATLCLADCRDVLPELGETDAVITDPPYGLSFMGKKWDYDIPPQEVWEGCLRALKPGGHLLAFAGTRTQHRMAVRIEDAGFEIRDMIAWVYGTGFPKSRDIGKDTQDPAWQGWGTALKPALEPITWARKPLNGTVAETVLRHGTGAINIDAGRVPGWKPQVTQGVNTNASSFNVAKTRRTSGASDVGRWPANMIHDGSGEVTEIFPAGSGGSAARFFYCAKASEAERGESNRHPTVKPLPLMLYLITLFSRDRTTVLDPFMGSGSTGVAAVQLGRRFIGIERDPEYFETACKRIEQAQGEGQRA